MTHGVIPTGYRQPGAHPEWCARDHRCDYRLGGLHRSLPERNALPVGTVTVWREGRARGYVVMQWSTAIRGDDAVMAARMQRALEAFQQSLLDGQRTGARRQ